MNIDSIDNTATTNIVNNTDNTAPITNPNFILIDYKPPVDESQPLQNIPDWWKYYVEYFHPDGSGGLRYST